MPKKTNRDMKQLLAFLSDEITADQLLGDRAPNNEELFTVSLLYRFDDDALGVALECTLKHADELIRSLTRQDLIIALPKSDGAYQVSERMRKEFNPLDRTQSSKLKSQELHARMAKHFRNYDKSWTFVCLYHELAVSPAKAIDECEASWRACLPQPNADGSAAPALSKRANDGISLAEAREILSIAQLQQFALTSDQQTRLKTWQTITNVWSEQCDAWFRSRRLLKRPRVEKVLLSLLDKGNRDSRILEIHAPGGSGKTMALRWLIAHHCIPRNLPIVHIDFDYLAGKSQHPSSILSLCIQQLSNQLPGSSLRSIVLEGQDLQESSRLDSYESVESFSDSTKNLLQHTDNLRYALAEALTSLPTSATIVVDTFEEAVLQGSTTVADFLNILTELVESCPALRLIVSGRLAVKGGAFGDALADNYSKVHAFYVRQMRTFRMPQFDRQEAISYLHSRGWMVSTSQFKDLPEVNLSRSAASGPDYRPQNEDEDGSREYSPFHLAMLADLWLSYQAKGLASDKMAEIEAELLTHMADVKVIYLIERVIARIEDVSLRWMVRYGAVPRKLTKDFFIQVVVPHMQAVDEGRSKLDDPLRDKLPAALAERTLYVGSIGEVNPYEAWSKLSRLADTNEWLERIDAETLLLHLCIKQPMRSLLKSHSVLRQIHQDAQKYFAQRREDSTDFQSELDFEQEEIYHEIQYSGGASADRICMQLEELYAQEQFERVAVCSQVIIECANSAEEDEVGIARAIVKLCCQLNLKSSLSLFDSTVDSPDKSETRARWLRLATAAWIKLRPMLIYQEFGEWESLFEIRQQTDKEQLLNQLALIQRSTHRDDGLWQRTEAILLVRTDNAACIPHLEKLLRERRRSPVTTAPLTSAWLIAQLAEGLGNFGTTDGRLAEFEGTCLYFAAAPVAKPRIFYSFAILLQMLGRLSTAANWITQNISPAAALPAELEMLVICENARRDPSGALKRLHALDSDLLGRIALGKKMSLTVWLHACVFDVHTCMDLLSEAIEIFRRDGATRSAGITQMVQAELWLHHFGHVNNCSQVLGSRTRSIRSNAMDDWRSLPTQLMDYELRHKNGQESIEYRSLLELARQAELPAAKLRCAITLLAYMEPCSEIDDAIIQLLIQGMERLPDWVARSDFPWLLRNKKLCVLLPPDQGNRILDLLNVEHELSTVTVDDQAWARIAISYLLRYLGYVDKARACLRQARTALAGSLTGMREVWNLNYLLNDEVPDPAELSEFSDQPLNLRAVVALEQTENAIENSELDKARSWLNEELGEQLKAIPGDFCARYRYCRAKCADAESAHEAFRSAAAEFEHIGNRAMALKCSSASVQATRSKWVPFQYESIDFELATSRFPAQNLDRLYMAVTSVDENLISQMKESWNANGNIVPHALVAQLAKDPVPLIAAAWKACFSSSLNPPYDLVISGNNLGPQSLPWEVIGGLSASKSMDRRHRCVYRTVANTTYSIRWLQEALRAVSPVKRARSQRVDFWSNELESDFENALTQNGGSLSLLRDSLLSALHTTTGKRRRPYQLRAAVLISDANLNESFSNRVSDQASRLVAEQIKRLYVDAGISCQIVSGRTIDDLMRNMPKQIDIVHVYATYVQRRSLGTVEPELVVNRTSFSGNQMDSGRTCPLLILDGPGPETPHEHMRQIILRNAAGTLLASQTRFSNIIGLPLEEEACMKPDGYMAFFQALTQQKTFLESLQAFADSSDLDIARRLALWSADPDLTLLSLYP